MSSPNKIKNITNGNKKKSMVVALGVTGSIVALGVAGFLVWWFVFRKKNASKQVNKLSNPTYLTMKAPTYGCPAQTFEFNKDLNKWVGDGSDQRFLVWDETKKFLACDNKNGGFSNFQPDDTNLCYHYEKDIKDKDGKIDLSKCVAGPPANQYDDFIKNI